MRELTPGVLAEVFARLAAEGVARAGPPVTALAAAVESQAKVEATNGSHPYGTPTPATPGSGPAVVSGTLRRSVTHTPARPATAGWEAATFVAPGHYPPYPKHGRRTASALYGLYLETGLVNGATYPFMRPAAERVRPSVPAVFTAAFAAPWPLFA